MTWLPPETFTLAVNALPLVSVDLCVTDADGRLLVGFRNNAPAKGWWFTPGGRVRKNEPVASALARVAREEIGLEPGPDFRPILMGSWDHFYPDSAFDPAVATHYVNLPHRLALHPEQAVSLVAGDADGADCQHASWRWLSLDEGLAEPQLHPYARAYLVALAQPLPPSDA